MLVSLLCYWKYDLSEAQSRTQAGIRHEDDMAYSLALKSVGKLNIWLRLVHRVLGDILLTVAL